MALSCFCIIPDVCMYAAAPVVQLSARIGKQFALVDEYMMNVQALNDDFFCRMV